MRKQLVGLAVRDPDWQAFRKSMKGKPTEEKLRMLLQYWTFSARGETEAIQIDNYLKALCRGGQLNAGESFETFMDATGQLRVRK